MPVSNLGLFVTLLVAVTLKAVGQLPVLTGKVTDSKTNEPVPFAAVFVNNTSNATETDESGHYVLKNVFNHVRGGSVEIVVSALGYTTFRQKLTDRQQDTIRLPIALGVSPQMISEVSVKGKRDQTWLRQYKKFERAFLGSSAHARSTKVLNPWVVDFEDDGTDLTASAQKIIEVENKALGYKLFFELQRFSLSPTRSSFAGLARFEPLKPVDERQKKKFEEHRQRAYEGSERHFFKALTQNRLKQEGFVVYAVNPDYREKTSFSHLNPQLGKRLLAFDDTLAVRPGRFPSSKEIVVAHELEILNTNNVSRIDTYQDAPFPVSWMLLRGGKAEVTAAGLLFDPQSCEWAGDIAERRIADMLPLDYQPEPLAENNNWQLLLPKDSIETAPGSTFAPEAAPVISIRQHFEADTIVFRIQVKSPDGTPVKGRLSVAIIEDGQPEPSQRDTLMAANVLTDNPRTDKKSVTLDEVKIKQKRHKNSSHTLLGKVDYVVESKDLKDIISGNVITALQHKVPGVDIFETIDHAGFSRKGIRIRGGLYGLQKVSTVEEEPLFLLDGIPYGTLENLSSIPISEVERIEVIKSANSLLGLRGRNGAINIVTKRTGPHTAPVSSTNEGKLFFWQPTTELSAQGEATVRFALPKGPRYFVTINGLTSGNQPFTHEMRVE